MLIPVGMCPVLKGCKALQTIAWEISETIEGGLLMCYGKRSDIGQEVDTGLGGWRGHRDVLGFACWDVHTQTHE